MCWGTNRPIKKCRHIADKDIETFKIINSDNTPYYYGDIVYEVGKVCPIIKLRRNSFDEIEKGYHSYSKEKCYIDEYGSGKYPDRCVKRKFDCIPICNYSHKLCDGYKLADFIIPKGTKYYENEWGEIVSETIKMV